MLKTKKRIPMNDLPVYILLLGVMVILNFVGKYSEPVSLTLCFAMLMNGFSLPLTLLCHLLSGLVALKTAPINLVAYAMQSVFLFVTFIVNQKTERKVGFDGYCYAAFSLLPYVFLSTSEAYSFLPKDLYLQRAIFAAVILLGCFVFTRAADVLLTKVFRCRLKSEELLFLAVSGVIVGLGLYRAAGNLAYTGVALLVILLSALVFKNTEALVFALVASLPKAIADGSFADLSAFILYASVAIFFSRENKIVAAVGVYLSYLVLAYFNDVYLSTTAQMILYLLSGAIPCLLAALLPSFVYQKAGDAIRSYREKQLPRIAINRNRAVVGERLFELSSLFRQIEGTFFTIGENAELGESENKLSMLVRRECCLTCPRKEDCKSHGVYEAIDRLITVGSTKGKVSVIDLPQEIATNCANSGGLMFCINQRLKDYGKTLEENESAESGRLLLAEQAHGISEVLKNIALEQSRPLNSYTEKEREVAEALAREGIATSELLIYGEEENVTVSLTVFGKYEGKKIAALLSKAVGFPLVLSEKITISHDKFSYVFRKKTRYDAIFGIASLTKEGESVSGDTHSVIKIDERRFLVALADGSGSGERAHDVSDATVSLLESFYRAKMPSDTILSTVNRLLTFTDDDRFSCLDVACVSLDDGSADVVKLGAPLGFIFSESEIRVLENNSLPLGAVESLHPTTTKETLKENDVLVFLSDGVTSAFGSSAAIFDYVKDFTPLNPQKLADDILNKAKELYGGVAKDDMTVVAVRIFVAKE